MREANRMNVDFQARIFADQRACRPSVVEMDVSEKDRVEIGDSQPVHFELLVESVERRSGTWID